MGCRKLTYLSAKRQNGTTENTGLKVVYRAKNLGQGFLSVDPLAHLRPWMSPYNFVQNNPINRIDPDGRLDSPIYDKSGEFLGTDDEGLQGEAIVMDERAFTQGMSHNEAKAFDNGTTSMSDGAKSRMNTHFSGLKDRPDWDGKLTFSEVTKWSNEGSGNPLFVDGSKIDLSPFTVTDVQNAARNNNGFIDFFDDWGGDLNTGRVYGNLRVTLTNSTSGDVILGTNGLLDIHDFRNGSAAETTNDWLFPGTPADFSIFCAPCNSKVEPK